MKAKCTVCGKEYEVQDGTKAADYVKEHPEKATCLECFKSGLAKKGIEKPKATTSKGSGKSTETSGRNPITAEVLRKAYDEVKAEFADVLDEVHDFIGGWTTTIALSKK